MDTTEVDILIDDTQNQQIVDELRSYLLQVGPALMAPGNLSFVPLLEESLQTEAAAETMAKFAINAENSILIINLVADHVELTLELTTQQSFRDLKSSFAILKVRDLPLDISRPVPLQVQLMSLLVDVFSEDNNEEARRGTYLQNMQQITRHLLAPLAFSIRATTTITQQQQAQTTTLTPEIINEEDDHMLALTKRIRELDFALEQCQRGSAIPSVVLTVPPIVTEKAKLTNPITIRNLLERYNAAQVDLLFQELVLFGDGNSGNNGNNETKREEFANEISKPAKLWPAEIMKQTRLIDTPFAGTIEKEITFWKDLDKKLHETKEQMDSTSILLAKLILKRTNRVSEQLVQEAESVLDKSMKIVTISLSFLRDFPIKELFEINNNLHPKLSRCITNCLLHFSKLKHSQYDFSRAIRLLEVLGNDIITVIITILREKNILQCNLEDLKQYYHQFQEVLYTWKTNLTTQRVTLKEIAKRRNEKFLTLKFSDFELLALRMDGIMKFREQHENMIMILTKVMTTNTNNINGNNGNSGNSGNSEKKPIHDTNSTNSTNSNAMEYDFVSELQSTYTYTIRTLSDIFDLSNSGNNTWLQCIQQYEYKLEKIEDKITILLSNRLHSAKTADEMFRIFALFNPLFFRPAIRNAVNSFRTVLMKNVREDVKKLQEKFYLRYDESQERITAELYDIPPLSGRIIWARQIEYQLNMLMKRIQDVLGIGWENHIDGKQLEYVCSDLKSYLNTNTIYEDWLTAQLKIDLSKYSKVKDFLLLVVLEEGNTTSKKYSLKVNFDDRQVIIYKEVKYLEWLLPSMTTVAHKTIPSTIKTRALEANHRYPIALALQSALTIYQQCKNKITTHNAPLLVMHLSTVRDLIKEAIGGSKRSKWIKWDSKEINDWIDNLTTKIYSLQERVEDINEKMNIIEKHLVALSNCPFIRNTMELILQSIQKVVDELPMKGLANVVIWVQQLDLRIETILLNKLEKAITVWIRSFEKDLHNHETSAGAGGKSFKPKDNEVQTTKHTNDEEDEAEKNVFITLTPSILDIIVSNQVLSISPSLEQCKLHWFTLYHQYLAMILTLPRLIAQRFQVFAEVSVPNLEKQTFVSILPKVNLELLKRPYLLINEKLSQASEYIQQWLQYQRLWDASISTITDHLNTDYILWQQFLLDMKQARSSIDMIYDEQYFGPIVINHRQAQMKIHLKYDIWQKECQNRFANIVLSDSKAYYIILIEMKTKLENVSLDGHTKDAIHGIGYIMSVQKQLEDTLTTVMQNMKSSEKLLSSQRYVFPSDWMPMSQLNSIYEDILSILERRMSLMNTQLPYLQNKIQEEDHIMNNRVEKFIENWTLHKPIEGTVLPTNALEVISLYATQLNKLLEEYNRLKHAKDCLQITYLIDYRLTSSESEIQDLREAWTVVQPIYEKLTILSSTLVKEMNAIVIRKQLEELMNELKNVSSKLRSYACVEVLLQKINKYITTFQVILKDLSCNALQDRHWKGLLDKLHVTTTITSPTSATTATAPGMFSPMKGQSASSGTPIKASVLAANTKSTSASGAQTVTMTATASGITSKTVTVGMIWQSDIVVHRKYIQEIVSVAQGELALENFLSGVKDFWAIQEFSLVLRDQNTIKIIVGWDIIFQSIEDYLLSLASMKQSPYFKNVPEFQEETNYWENKLTSLRVLLELWNEIQKKWLYLRNIFKNQDIKIQLPSQYNKFKNVDYEYLSLMKKVMMKPLVLDILNYDNLYKQLERQENVITLIQKSLNEYLEKQRILFPRFYFLNNEDLIEIIGNQQQEFYKICIHLNKMFAGVHNLNIVYPKSTGNASDSADVALIPYVQGMISKEGEIVPFQQTILLNQGVKEWLLGVQNEMILTLGQFVETAFHKVLNLKDNATAATAPMTPVKGVSHGKESDASKAASPHQHPLLSWMEEYPIQIMILTMQIYWTQLVEHALHEDHTLLTSKKATKPEALTKVLSTLDEKLLALSNSILYNLSKDLRKKCEQLLTEMIHQRDVIRQLLSGQANNTSGKHDFSWLYHLRFYWSSSSGDSSSPMKGTPIKPAATLVGDEGKQSQAAAEMSQRLSVRMSNAVFHYGFEYLGITERLVTTPLTDRCYLTLTQALHFRMGANPFGPAGTGKTESVKMLGTQLGRFVLVFNCDSAFDYAAMGRIFSGLCQVGAWGCFDEFNRLEERILSAVSQQILTIQRGLLQNLPTIDLIGQSCKLSKDVGIFVTLNPGYAGRSNLPDNLKQLFRAVAMSIPDRKLIAQVMLYSQGIITAEELAGKIVLLFILCEEQLSKQSHYDFGLRALKSVLVGAGELKRQSLPTLAANHDDQALAVLEMQVLIKSTYDSILPKLIAEDIPLFLSLLSVIFPDGQLPEVSDELFLSTVKQYIQEEGLIANDAWMEKLLQFKQIQEIRHGIILVGKAGTGKTSTWKTLLKVLTKLDGYSMQKAEYYIIDPKAISKDELFGYLDPNTLEWHDGIFTKILRKLIETSQEANNTNNGAEKDESTEFQGIDKAKRAWIIFDGDVDPEWAENLNSVLDDNKILTLPSGDRLQLLPNIRIIMEVDQLQYATLATVSRCGMIWFTDQVITKEMMFQRQFHRLKSFLGAASYSILSPHFEHLYSRYVEILSPYFFTSQTTPGSQDPAAKSIVELLLEFTLQSKHILAMTVDKWIETLFQMLVRGLIQCFEYLENPSNAFGMAGQVQEMSDHHLESFTHKWLFYSLLWSFGSSMSHTERVALGNLIEQYCHLQLPHTNFKASANQTKLTLLDYQPNVVDGEWIEWGIQVPKMEIEQNKIASSDVVITTVDTIRHTELLRCWLLSRKPIILCGPPGSGKTMTLTSVLESMPEYILVSLNFSSGTTPELLLKTFFQYCELVDTPEGLTLQPKKSSYRDNQWVIIFCDEINLPSQDAYGTQRVIMFLRQLTEQHGYWHPHDKKWIRLTRIQFVGACNPSSDAGRQEMSLRFLRQSSVLLVDYPAEISLKQIYRCFTSAMLRNHPNIKHLVDPLNHAMIEVYLQNKQQFTVDVAPQYIYSPRELSRWIRALHEAMESMEVITGEELVRLWAHEGLRLFADRLIHEESKEWCWKLIDSTARKQFPGVDIHEALQSPILYSNWITKGYQSIQRNVLKEFMTARLKVFYEEELDIPLVLFDDVLDHVLRIDNVLRHPMGHCLLVGESGTGKTVLTRFVAWMNGYSVFTIKAHQNYTIDHFDDDLRSLFRRVGIEGERICFIFDESNALSAGFLERMNALLASGDVPGLFEGEERQQLIAACRDASGNANSGNGNANGGSDTDANMLLTNNTEDEAYRNIVKLIQKNLHVVFTMNPLSSDFSTSCTTSPALFNRCVVNWFGTWSTTALIQIANEFIKVVDVGYTQYEAPNQHLPELFLFTREVLGSEELSLYDALVTAIVSIHHTVKQSIAKVNKMNTRQHYLSPRDFLDFIHHFMTLQEQKGIALQDQQQHLQHGLTKLRETELQVSTLNEELMQKKAILKQKDTEANEKLTQMISKQNETESKKQLAEKLTIELEKQNHELQTRKDIIEKELSEAEPALQLAKQSVSNIKKTQLDEVRTLTRPPNAVRLTMEMVNIMISPDNAPVLNEWADIRKVIRREDFITTVVNFDPLSLTNKQIRLVQDQYLSNTEMDVNTVDRASKACGPLFQWAASQIQFATILKKIKPLRDEMIVLQEQLGSMEMRQKEAVATVAELEKAIIQYKADYAMAIRETEMIKNEMETVSSKVTRANALLISLQQEKSTWETSLASFDQQMSTLLGDALLSAAFLTYIGIFDYKERKVLLTQWKGLFTRLQIPYQENIEIVEYLMKPYEIMTWINDYELPNDTLCIENMTIYSYYQRFPLIIDPSEQMNKFFVKKYSGSSSSTSGSSGVTGANQRLVVTSLLDPTFYKTLITSIRFGNILLIQDIEQISSNPLLFPILNKEFHHVHGRTFITLNNEEIDYSPKFQMIFITNNPYIKFSPDFLSRISLINFTITPQSLELQLFNTVLSYEYPSINEQRTHMIKVTNQQQHQLYALQTKLLTVINEIQGNILDDDSIMQVLSTIQSQSCTIQQEIAHTQSLLAQMQSISNFYHIVSQILSKIYFLLESLASIHFLYQYSLPAYFKMLSSIFQSVNAPVSLSTISPSVAGTASASAGGGGGLSPQQITNIMSDRMKYLLSIFLKELGRNILPGLQQKDQFLFIFRLSQLVLLHKASVNGSNNTTYDLHKEEMDYLTQGIVPSTTVTTNTTPVTSFVQKTVKFFQEKYNYTISSNVLDSLALLQQLPVFADLSASFMNHADSWYALLTTSHLTSQHVTSEVLHSCLTLSTPSSGKQTSSLTKERELLYKAMIMRGLCSSEGLLSVLEEYLQLIFLDYYGFDWRNIVYQQQNYVSLLSTYYLKDSKATIPILLCSEAGKGQTISQCIESVGQAQNTVVLSIAMGSNESYSEAEKLLIQAYKQGSWLIIKNIHLCIDWLYTLEKKLFQTLFATTSSTSSLSTAASSSMISSKSQYFRLFLTCEIHENLPISLLKQSHIIVYETSHGIKSNLSKYSAMIPNQRIDNHPPIERARLYHLLIWLHAVLQERLRYLPLGWSKAYELNDMDFLCSLDMIDQWIEEIMIQQQAIGRMHIDPTLLPWKALQVLLKESFYGGRIDQPFDQIILEGFIDSIFTPDNYQANAILVKDIHGNALVTLPDSLSHNAFLQWIEELPDNNPPSWIGLPETAEQQLQTQQMQRMLTNLTVLQGISEPMDNTEGDKGGLIDDADLLNESKQEDISKEGGMIGGQGMIDTISHHLQSLPSFDTLHQAMEGLQTFFTQQSSALSSTNKSSDVLYRLLLRELQHGLEIATILHEDLTALRGYAIGELKLTNHIHKLLHCYRTGNIPTVWKTFVILVSDMKFVTCLSNLTTRFQQLLTLVDTFLQQKSTLPKDIPADMHFTLGKFFHPDAFLMASRQYSAQLNGWKLEDLELYLDFSNVLTTLTQDMTMDGLMLQGAGYISDHKHFAFSDEMHAMLPKGMFKWRPKGVQAQVRLPAESQWTMIPIYFNENRKHVVYQVWVCTSNQNANYLWAQRSVAFILA